MKFVHRLAYYLGGFSIGLIILFFFLNGKNVSCSYGPEARVLKNINTKPLYYSSEASSEIAIKQIDTSQITYLLHKGDVVFSKSDTKRKPCALYHIEGKLNKKNAAITVENCEEKATLQQILFLE